MRVPSCTVSVSAAHALARTRFCLLASGGSVGCQPSCMHAGHARVPLFLSDIQTSLKWCVLAHATLLPVHHQRPCYHHGGSSVTSSRDKFMLSESGSSALVWQVCPRFIETRMEAVRALQPALLASEGAAAEAGPVSCPSC